MIKTIYQCNKCKKEQDYSMEEVDCCTGFKQSVDLIEYEPFEEPTKGKVHLCSKCYKEWSKVTCLLVYPDTIKLSQKR